MKTFEKAQIGDKVYSLVHGQCIIIDKDNQGLLVEATSSKYKYTYSLCGRYLSSELQLLYWSKPEISNPPAPKRLVEKVKTRYCNIYKNINKIGPTSSNYISEAYVHGGSFYSSPKEAKDNSAHPLICIAEVTIKFKVEE